MTTTGQLTPAQDGERAAVQVSRLRLAYATPRLRHLGSVRDLTLGTSNKAGEGGMRNM